MVSQQPVTRVQYNAANAEVIYRALRAAGIDFLTFLPDSGTYPIQQLMAADPAVTSVICAREDEGFAIAMGAAFAGKRPLMLMEGSGYGLSGLILARGLVQHTPVLILSSHNSALGEQFDYHAATRMVAESTLRALGIPYVVLMHIEDAPTVIQEAQLTVDGQRIPVAVLLPRHIFARTSQPVGDATVRAVSEGDGAR
jgi:sulfopyruvate decarboxylase subunit alpha